MHAISGGRFYRKEFERYEQETYLRSDAATSARKAAAPTEQEAYQQAQKADQRKKDKHARETNPNKTYADMTAVRSRAHKVLSLDDPQQVTYVNDPTGYTGRPYTIPDRVKNTFTPEQLDARILRDFAERSNMDLSNALGKLLPRLLIPVMLELCQIKPVKKCHAVTREERLRLVQGIKCMPVAIDGFRPLAEAIVTAGGVSVKEIHAKTMESNPLQIVYTTI